MCVCEGEWVRVCEKERERVWVCVCERELLWVGSCLTEVNSKFYNAKNQHLPALCVWVHHVLGWNIPMFDQHWCWIVQTNISGGQGMSFGEDGSETTQVTIPKDVSCLDVDFWIECPPPPPPEHKLVPEQLRLDYIVIVNQTCFWFYKFPCLSWVHALHIVWRFMLGNFILFVICN